MLGLTAPFGSIMTINYHNNPLHGTSLETLVTELVEHYGFEVLYAYLSINCFNKRPSIASSVKFLKQSDWAREKVESFYLYMYKNLPRASDSEYAKPPRDRIVPDGDRPRRPKVLSVEDAQKRKDAKANEPRPPSAKQFIDRRRQKKSVWGR